MSQMMIMMRGIHNVAICFSRRAPLEGRRSSTADDVALILASSQMANRYEEEKKHTDKTKGDVSGFFFLTRYEHEERTLYARHSCMRMRYPASLLLQMATDNDQYKGEHFVR